MAATATKKQRRTKAASPKARATGSKGGAGPLVGILMGSVGDLGVMNEAAKILEELGIAHEVVVTSAHRSPGKTADYAAKARDRGMQVLIVAAGLAAHLAGAVAANTTLPVLGVPIDSGSLRGMDALLSTVMMPTGVPVGTLAIGTTGARNAALFAAQILALSDARLARALAERRLKMADAVPGLVRRWPAGK
jgi:phosphoribosylaminoimidazole carboxylase PurE protein